MADLISSAQASVLADVVLDNGDFRGGFHTVVRQWNGCGCRRSGDFFLLKRDEGAHAGYSDIVANTAPAPGRSTQFARNSGLQTAAGAPLPVFSAGTAPGGFDVGSRA